MSARQRLRQWRKANRAPTIDDFSLAAAHLPAKLVPLFEAQHPRDIAHGAATLRWLLERGHQDADLVAASLLHDVGKGPQRRIDRALYTVASATRLAAALASERSRAEWRRAMARSLVHASTGGRVLEAAGAPATVVELTRRHHDRDQADAMLGLLQRADAAS